MPQMVRQKTFPAFHCVEYIYPFIINAVIHNFNRVAACIKAHEYILVFIILQKAVTNGVQKRPFNVGNGKAVLESRLITVYTRAHRYSIVPAGLLSKSRPDNRGEGRSPHSPFLRGHKFLVAAFLGYQLGVRSRLDNAAGLQHDQFIRLHNR